MTSCGERHGGFLPDAAGAFLRIGVEHSVSVHSATGQGWEFVRILSCCHEWAAQGYTVRGEIFTRLIDPSRRDSFLREFEILQELNHPSIMRVFDRGIFDDSFPFLIAEYLPLTLTRVIRADQSSVVEKISYVLQLLSALDVLAQLVPPVIHRDIKPANCFLKGHSCILGDFGLFKRVESMDEQDRMAFKISAGAGMPAGYRTPDLVDYLNNGTRPGTRSDIYQLGLVAAELFSGRNPQRPAGIDQPIELDPLADIRSPLGIPITQLIQRMLVTDPGQRESAAKLQPAWQNLLWSAVKLARSRKLQPFS